MVGKCFANVQWGPLAQNGCHLGPEWWRQTGATWGPKVVAPNRCHRFLPSPQGMRKKTSCVFLGGAGGWPTVGKCFGQCPMGPVGTNKPGATWGPKNGFMGAGWGQTVRNKN